MRYDLRLAEVQQTRLLAQQAAIIAGVFARLERLHRALRELAAPINHEPAGADPFPRAAIQRFEQFTNYYHERGIWLDPDTCTQLNEREALVTTLLTKLNYNLDENGQVADRRRWVETYDQLQKEVPEARAALDKQFRSLLGVGAKETTASQTAATSA